MALTQRDATLFGLTLLGAAGGHYLKDPRARQLSLLGSLGALTYWVLVPNPRPPPVIATSTPISHWILFELPQKRKADVERFIVAKPLPSEFRSRFPEIDLIEPGMPSTRELRSDNTRFFTDLDASGRIVGGSFA